MNATDGRNESLLHSMPHDHLAAPARPLLGAATGPGCDVGPDDGSAAESAA